MKRPTLRRLREYSPRDMLVVGLPLLLLVFAGFWLASRYIQPAPPDTLILSTGGEGGAYQRFAAAYKDILSLQGIRLVERPSAGSLENLARLRDPATDTDAAFVQGGAARVQENDELLSLGVLYNEPLWIFYRAELGSLTQLTELRGARVAIGPEGSGTRHLALELLHANRLEPQQLKLRKQGGPELASAFMKGQVDAAFAVGPVESATIWTLLHTPGLRLLNLSQAEAYTRQFPYLSHLILPRGAIDLSTDSPPQDTHLLATQATLVVRDGTHPALISLLMQALSETHDKPGIFQKTGEFPRAASADFPLAPEAERYYKSGKPLLQRYLPFWAATLVDRMIVMLIPLFAILIPLMRIAPGMYNWRIKSRIYRRYGELKFIEVELEADPGRLTRAEWHERVDAIEHDVNHMTMPLTFTDMVYTLRMHIGLVRKAIDRNVTAP
ncbi:MAG: TAXI family TRAP transporter solute-binding subunit [Rhodocyclaceae bacterium]|nr:TAXI family TRAP transporter solute-binding subunit [Rhodocyclaceae bacterium]MDZ4215459.1 TAXI family TRAP transporter solute-binding subunit [Rhodocyclaceae bacterium]